MVQSGIIPIVYNKHLHRFKKMKKISICIGICKKYLHLHSAIFAGIAQLVEHDLAKVGVAGSSPVSRSKNPVRVETGSGFFIDMMPEWWNW